MLVEGALGFGRVHVLAAAHDHVLGAVDDVDEALLVDAGDVSRVHPAIDEDVGGLLGAVPVAEHDVGAAGDDLAGAAGWHGGAVLIDDADGDALDLAPAGGESLDALGGVVVEPFEALGAKEGGGLGHAVGLGEDGSEYLAGGEDAVGGHGGGAEEEGAQGGEVVVADAGVVHNEVDHRGDQDGGGYAGLLDDSEEGVGGEGGDKGVRAAGGGH